MEQRIDQVTILNSFTEKQREVLALVSEGMTSKEIARKLGISESAVNQRIEVIRQRLGGLPRTQIARLYRRTNTVLITIPTCNSVTGQSIQLQPEPVEAQRLSSEGAEVSTTPSPATNPFGSHPSTLFPAQSFALDGPMRIWLRMLLIVAIAIGLLAVAVLVLTVATVLSELTLTDL